MPFFHTSIAATSGGTIDDGSKVVARAERKGVSTLYGKGKGELARGQLFPTRSYSSSTTAPPLLAPFGWPLLSPVGPAGCPAVNECFLIVSLNAALLSECIASSSTRLHSQQHAG
jgi:hypothetical protein